MKQLAEINYVNLIGTLTSTPKAVKLENGKRVVKFSLSTKETYLDKNGQSVSDTCWHRLSAWGKWVPILEELTFKGMALAIEGRLKSRFYHHNGKRQSYTEIEVNDLIIL